MILKSNDHFFQFGEKPFLDVNKSLYACEEFVNIRQLDIIGVLLLLLLIINIIVYSRYTTPGWCSRFHEM